MTSYRNTLEHFQHDLLTGEECVLHALHCTEAVDANQRMGIYREGYSSRLIDIVEKDFPVLKVLMGEGPFKAMAGEYVKAYRADHFSIKRYGRFLPEFLREYKDKNQVCYELAQLEWIFAEVGDAEDVEVLTLADLKTVPAEQWGDLILSFKPSVNCCSFYSNAPKIWETIHYENKKREVEKNATLQHWLIWRDETYAMFHRQLSTFEYDMVNAVYEKKSLSMICELLAEKMPTDEVQQFVSVRLHAWINAGLFMLI